MLCNDIVLSINRLAVVTSLLPVLQLIVIVVVCSSVDLLIQSLLIIYLFALSLVLVITTSLLQALHLSTLTIFFPLAITIIIMFKPCDCIKFFTGIMLPLLKCIILNVSFSSVFYSIIVIFIHLFMLPFHYYKCSALTIGCSYF